MFEQSSLVQDDQNNSIMKETGKYLWKHRNKIALGGVVCAAGIALYTYYNTTSNDKEKEEKEEQNRRFLLSELENNGRENLYNSNKPANRSRMLLKIRKQFDFAIRQFLPTMRNRIIEVVDVSSAIRKIKELRIANNNISISSEDSCSMILTEAILWDEIKVSSLTLLFVSAYMVSAVTVLLRVQLHILGKSMQNVMESQTLNDINNMNKNINHNTNDSMYNNNSNDINEDIFKILIDGTYMHIFSTGLQSLSELIKNKITEHFSEWSVRDKLSVTYHELIDKMNRIHNDIENNQISIIKMIMIRKFFVCLYSCLYDMYVCCKFLIICKFVII